ncbi:Phosphate regulon transcriptional regulatory protein PhoB (SphR) [Minicystis rosea]|nr:Phosphate regulon transcriptional regulatory protein PhoB (SphR) [Minicystis rosea]
MTRAERPTILIVDDDLAIRDLLEVYLKGEGYRILKAADGREALRALSTQEAHLVILDVMMEAMDGIETCVRIRREHRMPILMLSARAEDFDKIHGLTAGADDYMTKPPNPLELIARVKSQLRRYLELNDGRAAAKDEIVVGDLVINTATRVVRAGDRELSLTPKEFSILELLARHSGVVLSAERIYARVWDEPFNDSANTVMVHIRKIREKLGDNPRHPRYIKTVWGVGYRLEG